MRPYDALSSRPLDAVAAALAAPGVRPARADGRRLARRRRRLRRRPAPGTGTSRWSRWLLNRILDGLDGPLARQTGSTDLGGFLDLSPTSASTAASSSPPAIERPDARVACLVLLGTYYALRHGVPRPLLGARAPRRGRPPDARGPDRRRGRCSSSAAWPRAPRPCSPTSPICLLPSTPTLIAWVFAAAVAITAAAARRAGHPPAPRVRTEPPARPRPTSPDRPPRQHR